MSKSFAKFSVLIPVWFTIYLFNHGLGNDIYYEHLHITLWSVEILMAYTVFSLLWIVLSPLRASCCDGGIFEVLFYFFPVGLWCSLYMAQEDFVALIMVICFIIGLNYYFGYYSVKRYRKWPVPTVGPVKAPLRFVRQRFFLASTSVFLMGSLLMVLFGNGVEAKVKYSSVETRQTSSEEASVDYQYRILRLENLQTDRWAKLTSQQRLDTLQVLANIEADKLGIPRSVVSAIKITNVDSAYNTDLNQIVLDPEMVGNPDKAEDCVRCLLWAVHNEYIHFLVDRADFDSDLAHTMYFERVIAYRDNMDSYIEPSLSNYDAYASQPIIKDSTDYAESEAAYIFSLISDM